MSVFAIDSDKCDSCGVCSAECPAGIILIKEPGALPYKAKGGELMCINCGHCVAVCPTGALHHERMEPEECVPISRKLLPSGAHVEHLMKSRRSIRVYKEKPVPRETLAKLIDIARYAPSGGNIQPVHWLVIEDREEIKRLGGLAVDWMRSMLQAMPGLDDQSHLGLIVSACDRGIDMIMHEAPHLIVAHAQIQFGLLQADCDIALTYLELAAYSMGLGACWNGLFYMTSNHPTVKEALQLPEGHQCFGAMLIGYPKYKYRRIPLRKEPKVVWR